jgi:tetratricopeptide (TPR) repeat protein
MTSLFMRAFRRAAGSLIAACTVSVPLACMSGAADSTATQSAAAQSPAPGDRLAGAFKNLHQLRPDLAICRFTPLLVQSTKRGLKERGNAQLTARYLVLIARAFAFDQNYETSVKALSLAHALDPINQFATIYLADNLARVGRDKEARTLFEAVRKMAPENAIADTYLSVDALRSGDTRQAVEMGQQALKHKPGNGNWLQHQILGRAYAQRGFSDKGVNEYKQAIEQAPTAYYANLLTATVCAWEKKNNFADTSKQEVVLRAAGAVASEDPLWLAILGGLYSQRSDPFWASTLGNEKSNDKEARHCLQASVDCKRLEFKAFSTFVNYLIARKHLDSAWKCSQYVTNLMPNSYECCLLQGRVLTNQQKTAQARACFEKAVLLAPHVLRTHLELSDFLWRNNEHKAALAAMQNCADLLPSAPTSWSRLGEYHLQNGDWDKCKECFDKALQLLPPPSNELNLVAADELARVHAGLGVLAYHKSDRTQALKEAELWNKYKFVPELPVFLSIMKLRPGHIDMTKLMKTEKDAMQHAELADMLYQERQLQDCINEYGSALKLSPDDVYLHEYLFNVLTETGNWMGAANEDWTLSNKLISKIPHAIGDMQKKKKPASSGEKEEETGESPPESNDDK